MVSINKILASNPLSPVCCKFGPPCIGQIPQMPDWMPHYPAKGGHKHQDILLLLKGLHDEEQIVTPLTSLLCCVPS